MLIRRNLSHFARRNLGVVFGAALCTMVLAGALHVGDSVRASLRKLAENRTGQAEAFLNIQDSFFREALADELGKDLGATVAPVFMVRGTVSNPDADEEAGQVARVPNIQVLGVDERFFQLAPVPEEILLGDGQVHINQSLARRLGVKKGAILNLRLEEPSYSPGMPRFPGRVTRWLGLAVKRSFPSSTPIVSPTFHSMRPRSRRIP